jgi:hypothetical protein
MCGSNITATGRGGEIGAASSTSADERREIEQGRVARRRAEDRRQEALRAMERARCAGDWDAYWHYRRAAAQALSAERGYNEQIAQDKGELREAWQGHSPAYDADGD